MDDEFRVRRVVTGTDAAGRPVFVSDGPPPNLVALPGGTACADLWRLDGPPEHPMDGVDPPKGPFPLEPKPGGLWWRLIRIPAPDPTAAPEAQYVAMDDPHFDADKPGMHATDSIDFEVIISGRIELEVDEGIVQLGPGDFVVQRGTRHRWRVIGSEPCTYLAAMIATDHHAAAPAAPLHPRTGPPSGIGVRRVVTGFDSLGRSIIECDGEPPNAIRFANGGGMAYTDLWQTGGPLADPTQGGDAEPVSIQLDPIGMGICWKLVELPPVAAMTGIDRDALRAEMAAVGSGLSSTGHHDPNDPGNHRTDTLDLDIILEGDVELELPGTGSVHLGPGDCVVQQGNWHKWHNRGDTTMRLLAVMIGAPLGGMEG